MALGLSLYYTKLYAKQVNEDRENACMTLEDYRIPIFIETDGVILALGQNPAEKIAEEYMTEKCHINKKQKEEEEEKLHWVWKWLQYME